MLFSQRKSLPRLRRCSPRLFQSVVGPPLSFFHPSVGHESLFFPPSTAFASFNVLKPVSKSRTCFRLKEDPSTLFFFPFSSTLTVTNPPPLPPPCFEFSVSSCNRCPCNGATLSNPTPFVILHIFHLTETPFFERQNHGPPFQLGRSSTIARHNAPLISPREDWIFSACVFFSISPYMSTSVTVIIAPSDYVRCYTSCHIFFSPLFNETTTWPFFFFFSRRGRCFSPVIEIVGSNNPWLSIIQSVSSPLTSAEN